MHETKIEEYRTAAANCNAHAELDPRKAASWREEAAVWTKMADDLQNGMKPPAISQVSRGWY